jgi:hypothetical protein
MDYIRSKDGQIQADFARRLGIILKQYHESNLEEKYEVSLSLSILQSLLTNCVELLKQLKDREKRTNPIYSSPIDRIVWGFSEESIKYNSFNQPNINVEKVIRHIRNALSHPTKVDLLSSSKTTGYTTNNNSPSIENIIFISSPDLNHHGRCKEYQSEESARRNMTNSGDFPLDVKIMQLANGNFGYQKDGEPFYRIFEIEFSPDNLLVLTYSLASYLSHPLTSAWDGITFNIQKIAA